MTVREDEEYERAREKAEEAGRTAGERARAEAERLKLHGEALAGQWERLVLETTCASSYFAKKAGGCAACGTHQVAAEQAA